MEFGEDIANSWVLPKEEPPIPHAELLTLTDLSAKLQLKYEDVIGKLQARGITPDSSSIQVRPLAKKHTLTSQELYSIIRPAHVKPVMQEGGGFGRKTVSQIFGQYEIRIEYRLLRLHQKSIDASGEENLRELADTYETTPMDGVKIIGGSDE
jgi:hypothetical protein